ncbi:peptidylprolyl isomerase [Persephonella sp.]
MFINVGKSKWMKFILFVTTFAFVGTAFVALLVYKMSGNIQGIAEVNGKEIPMAEFYYQVSLITNQMESQGIDTAPLKKQIYTDAVRNVIQQELLYQEAEKEGITATKEEVKQYLLDIDVFKENGRFSKEKYLTFLSNIGLTPSYFEEILRKELSVRHLLSIHRVSFYLSEDEIDTFVNKSLSRVEGELLLIVPSEYKPTEKEVEEYYSRNIKDYAGKKGKLVAVYQISIKELGEEEAEKRVKQVYKALKNDQSVAEEKGVKKLFENPVYSEEKLNLPEKVIEELPKVGENKKIALVSDKENYYLIKYIKEVSQPLPLEKVKDRIISQIKEEKNRKIQEELYKKVQEAVKTQKDLKKLAQQFKGQLKEIKGKTAQTLSVEYGIPQEKLSLLTRKEKSPVVLQTQTGILVINIEKVKPPEEQRKQEMANLLKPILTDSKYKTLIQMYIDKLEKEAEITINRRVLQ